MADDEESRPVLKTLRARFLAEFILRGQGEILRFAQNDSEGLGMTAWKGFPAPCQGVCDIKVGVLPLVHDICVKACGSSRVVRGRRKAG